MYQWEDVSAICEHLYGIWGVECPVINQLQLDFDAFTCNLLGSEYVRLLLYVIRTDCSAKK
jgi:hypothetical protein